MAMDERGGIGLKNGLPWHLPDDLKRFKRLTMGHYLIVGRKTYESLGKPLAGRKMIVLSRRINRGSEPDILFAKDLEQALERCRQAGETEVFIGGGAEVFQSALPLAQKIYLTRVLTTVEADTFFPPWDESEWEIVDQYCHPRDEKHAFPFRFIDYIRRRYSHQRNDEKGFCYY
ncbi:MAG: dihydrofolate reductase [Anaerolineales bacterium]|nr:dihydrofolate reductase [Anaerolineales bacterium]